MAEGLQTADGAPIDVEAVNRDFARVMSADVESDVPAPPKRSKPLQEAEYTEPEKPKRSRPGRAERARTTTATPKTTGKAKASQTVNEDFTEAAQAAVGTAFTITAVIPPTQPLAFVLMQNADQLAKGLAEGAKHSETVRKWVSGSGDAGWKLTLGATAATMAIQALQIMRDPELKAKAQEAVKAQLVQMSGQQETAPTEAE